MPSVPLYVVFYFGKQSIEIKSPAVPKNRGAYGSRAEDGTRTRDPNLGKVMLYQLSYFRISLHQVYQSLLFLIASAKVSNFFISPNFSTRNLIGNINFISVHTDIIPLNSLSIRSFQYSSGIFINSKL